MFDEIKEVTFAGYKETGSIRFMSFRDEKFKLEIIDHTSSCPTYYEIHLDYWLHGQGWLNITTFCTYTLSDVKVDQLMEIAYMFIPAYIKPIEWDKKNDE